MQQETKLFKTPLWMFPRERTGSKEVTSVPGAQNMVFINFHNSLLHFFFFPFHPTIHFFLKEIKHKTPTVHLI